MVSPIVGNRIFRMPKCVKLNSGFHDSANIAFSSLQNAENELKNARGPRNRGFKNSAKSHFLAPKMKIWCTASINSPSSFRQLKSRFHQQTIQFPNPEHPVSVNIPSCFLQENVQFQVNNPSSFNQQTIQFPSRVVQFLSTDRPVSFKRPSSSSQQI